MYYNILEFVKVNLRQKYLENYFGILWYFIKPIFTIFVFWFVFEIGFKTHSVGDVPFVLWLTVGLFPWMFFSETLTELTNVFLKNSFLIKKIYFNTVILPVVEILSAFVVHICFMLLIVCMLCFYGYKANLYWLQVFYYAFALVCFLLSLSFIVASLAVFFKDLKQIISMILQALFWLTPIMWHIEIFPQKYQHYIKLNPLYYIINGYRESFFSKVLFFEEINLFFYFWTIVLLQALVGYFIYKKLRPHFSDIM